MAEEKNYRRYPPALSDGRSRPRRRGRILRWFGVAMIAVGLVFFADDVYAGRWGSVVADVGVVVGGVLFVLWGASRRDS